jgi:hypothetical protein
MLRVYSVDPSSVATVDCRTNSVEKKEKESFVGAADGRRDGDVGKKKVGPF